METTLADWVLARVCVHAFTPKLSQADSIENQMLTSILRYEPFQSNSNLSALHSNARCMCENFPNQSTRISKCSKNQIA